MPSTAAASRSSAVRTRPRSPSGTSDGSLIEPRSPRVAQNSTTVAPASAARASVPPQASDSSSGCANTASSVRPARSCTAGTAGAEQTPIDAHVFVDHAAGAEAGDRALANTPAVEVEDPWQLVHHLLEVREHDAGDPLVHDLADGAAVQRGHGCAARHRLGQHEPA